MPKQVDRTARRLELLDAMMRITVQDGWEGVSLRKVAAEAGVSMGLVQHYFSTKDEMLRFAIEMMAEDTRARIRRRVADLAEPPTPRLLVETVLTEMVPDPSRRATEAEAAKIWIRRFMLRPESQAVLNQGAADLMAALTDQMRQARPGDQAGAERDAAALIALLDGLIFNIVVGQQTAESAVAILRAQIDHVFRTPPADADEQIAEAIAAELESLSAECRADPKRLGRLLALDFHEFGTSGGEFVHRGTAELVAAATDPDGEPVKAENLRGWLVADGIVMLKYTSEHAGRRSNRTSLWRRVAPGDWQMFHHQGTLAAP